MREQWFPFAFYDLQGAILHDDRKLEALLAVASVAVRGPICRPVNGLWRKVGLTD